MSEDLEKENKKLRKMIKLLQDEDSGRSVEELAKENIELEKILEKNKDRIVQEETKNLIAQNRREMLKAETETLKSMIKLGEGDIELQKEKVKLLKEALSAQKEMEQTIKEGAQAAEDLGKSLGSAIRVTRGGVVDVGKIASGMGKAAKAAKGFAAHLKKGGKVDFGSVNKFITALAGNALISILQVMVDLATAIFEVSFAVENTTRAMQQATGMNRKLANSIAAGIPKVRKYTHEFKILAEASTALYRGFTDFTLINASTSRDLAENAAMLSRIGVSYDSFTGGVQMATKGMGVAAEDASGMMRNLTAHAENIGTDIGQLTSAFAESGSTLTKYGNDGVETFKRLSMTSKITGIDIQRLLAITEKFDTFEGAAEQAGMLNAALGGNFVNAMDLMMETDPRARFDMIRDSITQTAGSFENMGYYQRIYMAKAAGLKDVGELALMMSGNYELLDENMGKTSDSYIDQAKKARKWQSVQEELKTILYEMIDPMKEAMDMFKHLVKWLEGSGKADIKAMFKDIQQGIKWLANPENMDPILEATGLLARNLKSIAVALAAVFAVGTGFKAVRFFKKMKGWGTPSATGASGASGGTRISTGTGGRSGKPVTIKGSTNASRAAAAARAEPGFFRRMTKSVGDGFSWGLNKAKGRGGFVRPGGGNPMFRTPGQAPMRAGKPVADTAKKTADLAKAATNAAPKVGKLAKLMGWMGKASGPLTLLASVYEGQARTAEQAERAGRKQVKGMERFTEVMDGTVTSFLLGGYEFADFISGGFIDTIQGAFGFGGASGNEFELTGGTGMLDAFFGEDMKKAQKYMEEGGGFGELSTTMKTMQNKLRGLVGGELHGGRENLLVDVMRDSARNSAEFQQRQSTMQAALLKKVDAGTVSEEALLKHVDEFGSHLGHLYRQDPLKEQKELLLALGGTMPELTGAGGLEDTKRLNAAMEAATTLYIQRLSAERSKPVEVVIKQDPASENKAPVVIQLNVDGKHIKTDTIGTIGSAAGFAAVTGYSSKT